MANDYLTLAEIKAALPAGTGQNSQWSSIYDTLLGTVITAASRGIDRFTNREPGAYYVTADVTRYFDGPNPPVYMEDGGFRYPKLYVGEMATTPTSVAVAMSPSLSYTTLASTDYLVWPYNAATFGEPYSQLLLDIYNGGQRTWYFYRKGVQVVGKFGYSTAVPADVKQAVTIQAIRWFKRAQAAYQDTTVIVDAQQKTYQNPIDPDVTRLVAHLRRTNV